jgi:hypothetical protein
MRFFRWTGLSKMVCVVRKQGNLRSTIRDKPSNRPTPCPARISDSCGARAESAAAVPRGRVVMLKPRRMMQERRTSISDRRNCTRVYLRRLAVVDEDDAYIAADRSALPDRRLNTVYVEEIDCAAFLNALLMGERT